MRVICFGDEGGLKTLMEAIPAEAVCAVIVAEGRAEALPVAEDISKRLEVPLIVQPATKKGKRFEDFNESIYALNPDIGIIRSYSLILPESTFSIPAKGTFNVHSGLLPEYRGANVLNWVLINGEKISGVTIHKVTAGVDEGPVVGRKKVAVSDRDTVVTLREKLGEAGVELIRESWDLLCKDPVPCTKQDEAKARKWPRRKPEDGEIDWSHPAREIYNLIRALVRPWPGAFYIDSDGNTVVIDRFMELSDVGRLKREITGDIDDA